MTPPLRFVVLALALSGCVHLSNEHPDPRDVSALEEAWCEDGTLPSVSSCDLSRATVTVLYPVEFEKFTGFPPCEPDFPKWCYYAMSLPRKDGGWDIVIPSTTTHKEKAIRHELLHYASWCAIGNDDVGHTNEQVWEKHGPDTVEARANATEQLDGGTGL